MANKDNNKFHNIDISSDYLSDDYMKAVGEKIVGMMKPDTYGCDAFFVKTFINEDMQMDFSIIANLFYMNVPEALTFKNYDYFTDTSIKASYPIEAFTVFTLSQILSMAKSGNEFSVQLLKYLYKVYYKKEYKVLKKFKTISPQEIMSLSEDEEGENIGTMARILTLCPFFGIELDDKCAVLYLVIDKHNLEDEENIKTPEVSRADMKQFEETSLQVNDIFGVDDLDEIIKASKDYRKYDRFRRTVYKNMGYRSDFVDLQNGAVSTGLCYIQTLLILNKMYPNRKFTKEELQIYASIYYDTSIICRSMNEIDDYLKVMLGEIDDITIEESMFDPEEFEKAAGIKIARYNSQDDAEGDGSMNAGTMDPQKKPSADSGAKTISSGRTGALSGASEMKSVGEGTQAYEDEIDKLRSKLHKKEYDANHFADLYRDAKKRLEEAELEKQMLKSEHEELIALREHVYNMTEEDIVLQEKNRRELIASVIDKRIVIVGGHKNWVQKMRDVFPDWKYIDFKSVTTVDDNILNHIDHLYFFTDFIKHNVYYKFINLVRSKNVPFGYISSSNVDRCIKQIAEETGK